MFFLFVFSVLGPKARRYHKDWELGRTLHRYVSYEFTSRRFFYVHRSSNTFLRHLGRTCFYFFLSTTQLLLGKRTQYPFYGFFSTFTWRYCFFLPNQKSSVGWQGGRSVGYFKGKSNDRFTFMLLCLGRNQLRSSAAYRRINVFSGYDVTCILPYIHVLQVGCRHHIQPYSFACIIVI